MKILILNSKKMDSLLEYGEDSIIRMSKNTLTKYGFKYGELLNLRGINGEMIPVFALENYREDKEENYCYVTSRTLNKIVLQDKHDKNIVIELQEDITLGCDPELFLIDTRSSNILNASLLIREKYGQIGYDGVLLELRPSPAKNEFDLLNSIGVLIEGALRIIHSSKSYKSPLYALAASSYKDVFAGFHLHYGIPKELLVQNYFTKADDEKRRIAENIVRVMDYYVGIPAMLIEGEQDHYRRSCPTTGYGKPNGYRLDNKTLEYRMPGGYHLRHPELTLGLIGLGSMIMEDIISRISICTNRFSNLSNSCSERDILKIYSNIPSREDIYKTICSASTERARMYIQSIEKDLKYMVSYNKHAYSVDLFMNHVTYNTPFSNNIEKNWLRRSVNATCCK